MERRIEVKSQSAEDYLMYDAGCDVDLYKTEPDSKNYAIAGL